MEIERRVILAAPPVHVFGFVEDLRRYPEWIDLVHHVRFVDDDHDVAVAAGDGDVRRAWEVELRAQVGPLARSKRLRMVRSLRDPPHAVTFERAEVDGRTHAPWVLRTVLAAVDAGTDLSMLLTYGGSLWTGAVLQRVLDDHVERGAQTLAALVAAR
jgi:hypothetical protein